MRGWRDDHRTARKGGAVRRVSDWTAGRSLYSLVLRQTLGLQSLIIVLGLALPPLAVLPLHLQERIVDEGIASADFDLVLWLAGLYAAAVGLRSAIKFAVIYLRGWIAEIVARVLRTAMIDAQRHRNAARARESLGAATSVLAAEVEPLGGFSAEALNTPLIQGGTLLGVFGYMFATEAALAVIGLSALGLEAVVTPILQARINRLARRKIEAIRRAEGDVIGATEPAGARLVIASLGEVRESYRLRLRMNVLKATLKIARNLIDHAADIAILCFGAAMVIDGQTEIGVILAFMMALRQIRDPWSELVNFYRRFADARIKYKLVRAAVRDPSAPIAISRNFGYDGRHP